MSGTLIDLIQNYGYLIVFLGSVLEGESMLLAGSFTASLGLLNFFWVIISAFFGAIIGDNLTYLIGKKGGRPFLDRFGKYVFLTPKRQKHLDHHFKNHGGKTMFITRFVWGSRLATTLLAGALGMNYRQFVTYNCLSAAIWATLIGTLGFLFGHSWTLLKGYLKGTAISLLIFFALAYAVKTILRHWLHKELDADDRLR
ncbi:MAG: hypothetical protein A2788_00385 [Candidatus Abawacabacteria bacterium RIFCSPHIGHO2_01_FULL_46_8]|uniref:VTT domain-containing protein n=1 Tax=Candidatus Abawacabacteria bacterium RIFCSPHIGHO2_01_FULL_46_8 TaxID=1817815 RepID=A0A1F4XNU8_9BACT|nr:MAG: hypothetical protein A2788_00385 [Candidatus Abawacabacteria bacterium RIFCSPHIGHO2_01_FULL_46_8]